MRIPDADLVLYTLSAVLTLWGLSLVYRGAVGERKPGVRACFSCGEAPGGGMVCGACGAEAARSRDFYAIDRSVPMALWGSGCAALGVLALLLAIRLSAAEYKTDGDDLLTMYAALSIGAVLFGLALLVRARLPMRSSEPRCPRCWYEMKDVAGRTCPECGHRIPSEGAMLRVRRPARSTVIALGVLLLAACSFRAGPVARMGWRGVVPTTVLILGYEWLPETLVLKNPSFGRGNDGSLEGRVDERELFGWQTRLLQRRVREDLDRGISSFEVADRAFMFVSYGGSGSVYENYEDVPPGIDPSYLLDAMTSSDHVRRMRAAEFLDRHHYAWKVFMHPGPDLTEYVPRLIEAITDKNPTVQMAAAVALGPRQMGFTEQWVSTTFQHETSYQWALGVANQYRVKTGLSLGIDESCAYLLLGAFALTEPGREDRILESIRAAPSGASPWVAVRAMQYAIRISEDQARKADLSDRSIAVLRDRLAFSDDSDAAGPLFAVARVSIDDDAHMKFVLDLIDSRPALAYEALQSVAWHSPAADAHRDRIAPFLSHDDPGVRRVAAQLAERFEIDAEDPAYALLVQLRVSDPDEDVRFAADSALIQIEQRWSSVP